MAIRGRNFIQWDSSCTLAVRSSKYFTVWGHLVLSSILPSRILSSEVEYSAKSFSRFSRLIFVKFTLFVQGITHLESKFNLMELGFMYPLSRILFFCSVYFFKMVECILQIFFGKSCSCSKVGTFDM